MGAALNDFSAAEAARRIAAGEITAEALARACLARIAEREARVHAWAHLDPEQALDEARARDATRPPGPLHGVPIAVKDVIETCDSPCGMGSPIYEGYRPAADAACVATVRAAGAVILGKTVTAEFAGVTPGPTTNPLAPSRTPGGSSSGSAAAVADRMVPVAFGTQTGGSILRPASYCGVIGFKPSFGTINRAGLKLAAESLDTIGLIAREIEDIALTWGVLVGRPPGPVTPPASPPRLAIFRTHHWKRAEPESVAAVEETARCLRGRGARVTEIAVPEGFAALSAARAVINNYERARALAWEWAHHRDSLSPRLAEVLADGWATPYDSYIGALRQVDVWRGWLDIAMADHDALLTPAVNGEAPEGLGSTGDTSFQEVWTVLHAPTISLPLHRGPAGMPVGVQLVGRRLQDEVLLRTAGWVWDAQKDTQAARTPTGSA